MTLLYTPEQEEFSRSIRRFLHDAAADSDTLETMSVEVGFERRPWFQAVARLGLTGLLVPPALGGSGAGPSDVIALFEEFGRALFAPPVLTSAVIAPTALLASGDEGIGPEILSELAGGSLVVVMAVDRPAIDVTQSDPPVRAEQAGASWILSGTTRHVIDGQDADMVLVPARTDRGISLFAVDGRHEAKLRIAPLRTLDLTRRQADLEFYRCPARLIGREGGAGPALDEALTMGALAVAAEALGGAARVLDLAVEHANERIQFGRRIGSFQAIKHKCADMKLLLEASRAAVHQAADSQQEHADDRFVHVSIAKAYTCDAYFRMAAENLQIHGGMGCTWEHPAHLHLRRAKSLQQLLGATGYHRAVVARHLGV